MFTDQIAATYLYAGAAVLAIVAWFRWPKLDVRIHQERPNPYYALWEASLVLFHPRPRGKTRRPAIEWFEISFYLSIKRRKR